MSVFLVSGCSSGVGYALCEKLLKEGFQIIGIARKVGRSAKFLGKSKFKFFECDLNSQKSIEAFSKDLGTLRMQITHLINNASTFSLSNFSDLSTTEVYRILNTNIQGTIHLTKQLIDCPCGKLASIYNILSVSALGGHEQQACYSASKHALKGFFDSLAQEQLNKIDITNFYPGGINSELWSAPDIKIEAKKLDDFIPPEDVADLVYMRLHMPSSMVIKEIVFFPKNDWH